MGLANRCFRKKQVCQFFFFFFGLSCVRTFTEASLLSVINYEDLQRKWKFRDGIIWGKRQINGGLKPRERLGYVHACVFYGQYLLDTLWVFQAFLKWFTLRTGILNLKENCHWQVNLSNLMFWHIIWAAWPVHRYQIHQQHHHHWVVIVIIIVNTSVLL